MRPATERLRDMLMAIDGIERHTSGGKAQFAQDDVLQGYVAYQLMMLGEAAYKMSRSIQRRYQEIPWRQISGLRHVLVHGYFAVDLDIVWGVVERDLPSLRVQLERVLSDLAP